MKWMRALKNFENLVFCMKKIFVGLLCSLVGVVGSLLVIELGYRLLLGFKSPSNQYNDRPLYYFQASGSDDLRDYKYGEKSEDAFRIAVVGDSFSFAPYMQFTDSFPKVLERMLNLNETTLRGEVVNYGVPGYSTSHEIRETRQAVQQGADVVLLQITLNDAELKPYRPIGITNFDNFGNLKVTGWKKVLFNNWKSLAFVMTRIHNEQTRRDYIAYFNDLFFSQRSWKEFQKSLRRIASITKKNNIPLMAVVFPLYGLPLDESYPFHSIHQRVAEELASHEVETLDLFSAYEGVSLDRIQVIPGEDRHPNEIGHRIAAESIYSWLESNNVIPEPLRIEKRYVKRTQIVKEKVFDSTEPIYRISRLSHPTKEINGLD
jgi:lysophospholipase L1-like esterase